MSHNWIVPYSSVSNLNCASFHGHQSKLCLNPITQNWNVPNSDLPQWIVPYSNGLKLNCALFQPHQIELCLIPMSHNRIVPYSNVPKLNCALIQCLNIQIFMSTITEFFVPNSNVPILNRAWVQPHCVPYSTQPIGPNSVCLSMVSREKPLSYTNFCMQGCSWKATVLVSLVTLPFSVSITSATLTNEKL